MRILTFDIEEWFHILDNSQTRSEADWAVFTPRIYDNLYRILDFLDVHNQKATFFCLGWLADKYPALIKEIDNRGHEIGSHSYMHQLVYEQNRKEFTLDLQNSINSLEQCVGKKVRIFRAPGFSITSEVLWALDVLLENGIEYDSSIFPTVRSHGGIASFGVSKPHVIELAGRSIKEFPINVHQVMGSKVVFSGGGYFRLLPYQIVRRWSGKSDYVMTYFHPRDFDPDQPMVPGLSPIRKFKSYVGLKGALNKLDLYLKDFDFMDIGQAAERIDWEKAERVILDKSRDPIV